MSQLNYLDEPTVPGAGVLADSGDNDIVSRFSAAIVPFGRMLAYDAAEGKVKLPAVAGDLAFANLEGIAVATQAIENQADNTLGVAGINAPAYPATMAINVLRRGRIWAWVEQAVAKTDSVFVRHTAAVNEVAGNFRKDADTANAVDLGDKAHFETETSAAGWVQVNLNL